MLSFYFFPSDLHSFGDELNSSSKTAPANIGAHKNWSKHLGISNCVFTMNCSTWQKIVFWSFLGRDFICWGATKFFGKLIWRDRKIFYSINFLCGADLWEIPPVMCFVEKFTQTSRNSITRTRTLHFNSATPKRRHFLQETHISRPKGTISREIIKPIFGWFCRGIEGGLKSTYTSLSLLSHFK